jgi:hypothetical protein
MAVTTPPGKAEPGRMSNLLLQTLEPFVGGSLFLGLLLFLSAGTFDYW